MSLARRTTLALAVTGAILLSAPLAAQHAARPPEVLCDLYASSILEPRDFDRVIQAKKHLLASGAPVGRHLRQRLPQLQRDAEAHVRFCDQVAQPGRRWECLNQSPASALFVWSGSLVMSLGGMNWVATPAGEMQLDARRTCAARGGAAMCDELLRTSLRIARPFCLAGFN